MKFKFSDMPAFKEQGCCDSGCGCATFNEKSELACPLCMEFGEKISNITVYSLTKKALRGDMTRDGDDGYNICLKPSCKCVYYSKNRVIKTDELKREFHLKDDSTIYTVCYCLKITKDEIVDAVQNKKLTGMKDIMRDLKGEPPCVCHKNNPTGLCCENEFNDVIKEAIVSYTKN